MDLPDPLTLLALSVIEGTSTGTDLLRQLEGIPLAGLTKLIINTMGLADADFGSFLFALGAVINNLLHPISVGDEPHNTAQAKNDIAQGIRTTLAIASPKKIDQDIKPTSSGGNGLTNGIGIWQKIDGLADDQVFIVQRFRISHELTGNSNAAGWLFIYPGRPFGSHLGQDVDQMDLTTVTQLSPGEEFNFGDTSQTIRQNFILLTKLAPVCVFRIETAFGPTPQAELDLKPNYVSLRSYWQVWLGDDAETAGPLFTLQLFGQKMPYSLPDDLFKDSRH